MAASTIKIEPSTAAAAVDVATKTVSDVHYQKMQMVVGDDTEAVVVNNGQQISANSVPVVLPSDQVVDVDINTLGQQLAAASISVVLASDHGNVPVSSGVKSSGTASTLTGVSTSTPVDLDVSDYDEITLFWDITANSGSWQLVIQAYTPTESNEVDLMSSPPMTTTGCVMLTLNVKTLLKLKLSHVRTSGTITSTTQYCGK